MKFPRNARIFRGQLDAAPLALVFFLLVIFLMLGSLLYTPGVRLQLPMAADLPGTDKPTIAVAIDSHGRLFFQNQLVDAPDLTERLRAIVKNSPEPLTLLLQSDRSVSYEQLLNVTLLAREAGIQEAWLATLPRDLATPANVSSR
jgi:biopolymer transport protein ExbD